MVTREIRFSDLSGKEGAETVRLGYGDSWHELELTAEECETLEATLRPYLTVARPAPSVAPRRVVPEMTAEERAAIRTWGRLHGFDFADRGRIPRRIIDAYDESHGIEREWPEG